MLVARNLGYMNQVHSTLNYSRKLAALGRLMAGVAHEVKNPLNAMTIHLELLKEKLSRAIAAGRRAGDAGGADRASRLAPPTSDVNRTSRSSRARSSGSTRSLNGFLKFARPDELKLQPVHLQAVISDIVDLGRRPRPSGCGVTVKHECPPGLPRDQRRSGHAAPGAAEPGAERLPGDARRRHAAPVCRAASRGRVEIDVEDTGVGIPPENLQKIFDLYFTTKDKGSGIGLSMVYRIVQLHDGEVEVQSTPGAAPGSGWSFRRRKLKDAVLDAVS